MNTFGYYVGMVVGAAVVGAVIGLIPMIVRFTKHEKEQGIIDLGETVVRHIVLTYVLSRIQFLSQSMWLGVVAALITLAYTVHYCGKVVRNEE